MRYQRGPYLAERTATRIRKDSVDVVGFSLLRQGSRISATDCLDYADKPGNLLILDYTQPFRVQSAGAEVVALQVPRDIISRSVGDLRREHGQVARGGLIGLLSDHLMSLAAHADGLRDPQAAALGSATEQLLAAALSTSRESLARAAEPIANILKHRALKHIESRLTSPDLTPENIARSIGVSRRKLYEVFEAEGGVSRHIFARRLERAKAVLERRRERGLIKEVAFGFGFQSEAHFCRAFRARFGFSPTEAYDQPGAGRG